MHEWKITVQEANRITAYCTCGFEACIEEPPPNKAIDPAKVERILAEASRRIVEEHAEERNALIRSTI